MKSALVLYHYFYPDDVVSAIHLTELSTGLAQHGWRVVALPCNRGCRDESKTYSRRGEIDGVEIRRIWRPRLRQATSFGRISNAIWMVAAWSLMAFNPRVKCDAVIIGTDPIFSVVTAIVWRLVRPRVRIAHWCFDLHPETAIADGLLSPSSVGVRLTERVLARAYKCCDLVADLGHCMRERLGRYGHTSLAVTLPPWALEEPDAPVPVSAAARESLFPDARLALLYSGSFGRAHTYSSLLQLAALVADDGVQLTFSVRGNREEALRNAVNTGPANVTMAGFVPQDQLKDRLAAADVHVVSLHERWTGTVVPSKFFGALAIGRPVIFAGSMHCSIARWIVDYQVGWVLTPETLPAVAAELRRLSEDPAELQRMNLHCHRVYHEHFSRSTIVGSWSGHLTALVESEATQSFSVRPDRRRPETIPQTDADTACR